MLISLMVCGQVATKVVVTTQPVAGTGQGGLMPVQPVVEIRDASNQRVTTSTAQVQIVIVSGSGGTIGGTTTINAVNGVAAFTDLTFTGCRLKPMYFSLTVCPSSPPNLLPMAGVR